MKSLLPKMAYASLVFLSMVLLSSSINAQTTYNLSARTGDGSGYRQQTCGDSPSPMSVEAVLASNGLPSPIPVTVSLTGGYKNGYYESYNPTLLPNQHCPGPNGFTPHIGIKFSRGVPRVQMYLLTSSIGATVIATGQNGGKFTRTVSSEDLMPTVSFPATGEKAELITDIDVFSNVNFEGRWDVQILSFSIDVSQQDDPTQNPPRPPRATDSNFVATNQPGLNTGCTYNWSGPLKIEIPINRVVGDVDSGTGKLEEPELLVANGVVSKYAVLTLPAWDVNYAQGERDRVVVNGVDIGKSGQRAYLVGTSKQWAVNKFLVPIEVLNFGKRVKGQPATPGKNTVEIWIDEDSTGNRPWCTSVGWASLSFEALYPFVMVHGNNSCPEFFAGDYECKGEAHPDFTPDEYFVKPFVDRRIPYDNSIRMRTNTIDNHAQVLNELVPSIAAEFGAKHLHLIAHSKGGLDVRKYLTLIAPDTLGVLSLTTLSTPHWGSVGADYVLDADKGGWRAVAFSDRLFRATLAKLAGKDDGTADLRVSAVAGFNQENIPLLPKGFTVDGETTPFNMYTLGGDANLNSSASLGTRTITLEETRGTPSPLPNNFFKETIYEMIYNMMGTVHHTTLDSRGGFPIRGPVGIREFPTTEFRRNDFLVTVQSSNLANKDLAANGFTPKPGVNVGFIPANHATMATAISADLIIRTIQKEVQPIGGQ